MALARWRRCWMPVDQGYKLTVIPYMFVFLSDIFLSVQFFIKVSRSESVNHTTE